MEKVAEQLALDFANGEYNEVFHTLTSFSNVLKIARLSTLVYKELEKASQTVSINPEDWLEWLKNNA